MAREKISRGIASRCQSAAKMKRRRRKAAWRKQWRKHLAISINETKISGENIQHQRGGGDIGGGGGSMKKWRKCGGIFSEIAAAGGVISSMRCVTSVSVMKTPKHHQ